MLYIVQLRLNFNLNMHFTFPDGLGVRIPDSHSGGPGSIPGQGAYFYLLEIARRLTYRALTRQSFTLQQEMTHWLGHAGA